MFRHAILAAKVIELRPIIMTMFTAHFSLAPPLAGLSLPTGAP